MTAEEVISEQPIPETLSSAELNARASARAESRMLIGGKLVGSSSGETFKNVSPATGKVLGSTAAATFGDMDAAIASARRAFDDTDWSTNVALRKHCLMQLQDALEQEQEDLREELVAEAGAPLMTTHIAQLDWPLADGLCSAVELLDSFAWERRLDGGGVGGDNTHRVVWKEAVGVVGAIVPWNFPFEIAINKLAQALATGNTLVLKPDPNTPWTSTRLGRLIAERTDLPPGVVNVVPTPDNSVAQLVVTDPRVDLISFTGSTSVGKVIAGKAAETLKRVFLELGGKSAAVMLEDADIEAVIPNMAGVCMHAGQGCGITTRLVTPRSRLDEVMNRLTEMFELIPPGDPALPDTLLGPVINARQQERILGYVDRARAAGAEIAVGGTAPRELPEAISGGTFVLPTLVAGVDNSAEIAREEVFGPVLVVLPYDSEDEALRIANDSEYGLSGAVFSTSRERALTFARNVRTGSMSVNGGIYYGGDAPFGGYKASGIGRQNGLEGFESYLETKLVAYT
ncbi:aldehyde dehydrogenase family protein [Mycolicibacterium moriokaense]|uniref:Aldehyde dehydrogenase (NAD+) n=1 Tax=Mycolicibacterium moriokaense TaxID=39691 RepID=A0A318HD70_9MYCO|nr:aldehyde dehydrogenase family protein [Mycolicibacterium moriokaense]PXX01631.1 aldehyde dehydrogenase (NAD+) [Mycolicibacterium moriokaense]